MLFTYFSVRIAEQTKLALPIKIGIIAVIAAVAVSGILALLTPEPEDAAPAPRLYTEDEVAALIAAVHAGRLVPAPPAACKFCNGGDPDATGVDGSRYHLACFQAAFRSGRT